MTCTVASELFVPRSSRSKQSSGHQNQFLPYYSTYGVQDREEMQLHEVKQTTSSSSVATTSPTSRYLTTGRIRGYRCWQGPSQYQCKPPMSTTTMEDYFNQLDAPNVNNNYGRLLQPTRCPQDTTHSRKKCKDWEYSNLTSIYRAPSGTSYTNRYEYS